MSKSTTFCISAVLIVAASRHCIAANNRVAVLDGYSDHAALQDQLEELAASRLATLTSLGTTLAKHDVFLLTIGTGKPDQKPAILFVGGVDSRHLVGTELILRLARRLIDRAKTDKSVQQLLDRVTFYVIPRAAPDGVASFFNKPFAECARNCRVIDDDGDGRVDEDPAEDMNGDGWITTMRVVDPTGEYLACPEDERVLIKADAEKQEQGRYRLYTEGFDNDGDKKVNEDPVGGVNFNRNFTFRYPYFASDAGPHQVSEIETRAVADFAFSHPNIGVVLTCTPEDNLLTPWKADAKSETEPIKTHLLEADTPSAHQVSELYKEAIGDKPLIDEATGEGSFSEWAYFHYGRWSFAFRGWNIPEIKTDAEDSTGNAENEDAKTPSPTDANSRDDATGSQEDADDAKDSQNDLESSGCGKIERNALRWFEQNKIDGFIPWKRIDHPDFPGQIVELGGFRPFYLLNPPSSQFTSLEETHWSFLVKLAGMLPRLSIPNVKTESLGNGIWRVTATVVNEGDLPTMSEMGRLSHQVHPLQIELTLPKDSRLVTGYRRQRLPVLAGHGGRAEQAWLVSVTNNKKAGIQIRAWSPSVGTAHARVVLDPAAINKSEKGR